MIKNRRFANFFSLFAALTLVCTGSAYAHSPFVAETKGEFEDKFRQLDEIWPTPNEQRTASGAPGPEYWQQTADYRINATLDEEAKRITAAARITYTNASPDTLDFIWIQLDQNRFREDSLARRSESASRAQSRRAGVTEGDTLSYAAMHRHQAYQDRSYGFEIESVTDGRGAALDYVINDTMMRVDLRQPLRKGRQTVIVIDWAHNIVDEAAIGARGGYEHFPENDTYIYSLAQWFPRVAAYTDYGGWHTQPFLGRGEFTLEFGDYEVQLTVPADHVVAATGVLQNPRDVLSAEQRERLSEARRSDEPVYIVSPDEARENEAEKTSDTRTWRFTAKNVRDFAWASSRKFVWDAMTHEQDGGGDAPDDILVMSFYPNEGDPIWGQFSSHSVAHALDVYSRFSFPYPYPTAISVNAWERGGMEYPMITFNGYRPVKNPETGEVTYSRAARDGLIGVIIHEVGHFYFPMIVNSDERQWGWMDEGLNTFLEWVSETEWDESYPIVRDNFEGPTAFIVDYMLSETQAPIMTQADSVHALGPNAYLKPTAALTVLRETVIGRELFDAAFKEYAKRWQFKRPTPIDFFRTMEDVSGVDLDWFWRGWFYSTDHVDIAITGVREYQISSLDPDIEFPINAERAAEELVTNLTVLRNREEGVETYIARHPHLRDFYDENDRFTVSNADRNLYAETIAGLEPHEKTVLERAVAAGEYVYFVDFENQGGLVSPLPLELTFDDGETEFLTIPAEFWRRRHTEETKLLIRDKPIVQIAFDPRLETADADRADNRFPQMIARERIELYKNGGKVRNLMGDMLVELELGDEVDPAEDAEAGGQTDAEVTEIEAEDGAEL